MITRYVRHAIARPFVILGVFLLAALLCLCMCGAIALFGGGRNRAAPAPRVMTSGAPFIPTSVLSA